MNTINRLSDNRVALMERARDTFGNATSHLPRWLEAGAVLSVAKTSTKAATTLVRRNPGVTIAIGVIGAGVLAYRFYRRRVDAKRQPDVIEGQAEHVSAEHVSKEVPARSARKAAAITPSSTGSKKAAEQSAPMH